MNDAPTSPQPVVDADNPYADVATEEELMQFRNQPVVRRICKALEAHSKALGATLDGLDLETANGLEKAKSVLGQRRQINRFLNFVRQPLDIEQGKDTHDTKVSQSY